MFPQAIDQHVIERARLRRVEPKSAQVALSEEHRNTVQWSQGRIYCLLETEAQ
jgi:hypothetical protein